MISTAIIHNNLNIIYNLLNVSLTKKARLTGRWFLPTNLFPTLTENEENKIP